MIGDGHARISPAARGAPGSPPWRASCGSPWRC